MTATEFALRTDGVGKRYRKGWALRDCTLALPAGGVIALVGPNGAGKTTLLRLVVGLLAPSTGTVEVLGHDVTASTPHTLSRVGFLAQDHPLYKRFTVAEMLRFGRACNLRFDQGLAERRLAKLGIPLDRRTGTLSGGQQAQVALALALAKRPDLLVLDEPVASLDPLARHEFMQVLMGAVAEGGVTVLFSSHVVHELERVCDHLIVLNHGRVTLTGDIETLLTEHRLLVGPRTTADLGPVSKSMFAIAGPDAAPGGTAERPTYNSGMRAIRPHRQEPPQARLSSNGTSIQALARSGAVVEAVHSDRHTTLLVRDGAIPAAPGWQAQPVALEDLVLAYLRRPSEPGAAVTSGVAT